MTENKRECVYCGKDCEADDYQMVAMERPYKNLFIHPVCMKELEKEYGEYPTGMVLYLTKNTEIWYN
jgi:hypothetical protein